MIAHTLCQMERWISSPPLPSLPHPFFHHLYFAYLHKVTVSHSTGKHHIAMLSAGIMLKGRSWSFLSSYVFFLWSSIFSWFKKGIQQFCITTADCFVPPYLHSYYPSVTALWHLCNTSVTPMKCRCNTITSPQAAFPFDTQALHFVLTSAIPQQKGGIDAGIITLWCI
jgi:hypothetical protein